MLTVASENNFFKLYLYSIDDLTCPIIINLKENQLFTNLLDLLVYKGQLEDPGTISTLLVNAQHAEMEKHTNQLALG